MVRFSNTTGLGGSLSKISRSPKLHGFTMSLAGPVKMELKYLIK